MPTQNDSPCFTGRKLEEILGGMSEFVQSDGPNTVFIVGGYNDINSGGKSAAWVDNQVEAYENVLADLTNGEGEFIYAAQPDDGCTPVTTVADAIESGATFNIAQNVERFKDDNIWSTYYSCPGDGIHPVATGYAKMAEYAEEAYILYYDSTVGITSESYTDSYDVISKGNKSRALSVRYGLTTGPVLSNFTFLDGLIQLNSNITFRNSLFGTGMTVSGPGTPTYTTSWRTDVDGDPITNSGGIPLASSPLINAGTGVGLTTDYLGNTVFGTPDIGAYEYQETLSILSPTGFITDTRPSLFFRKAVDAGGVSLYSVGLDTGKNQSFSTGGIPSAGDGTAGYVWKDDDYAKVEFLSEDDSDSANDKIKVLLKGLDTNELTEGKHSWNVTAYDSSSNTTSHSTDFYIDRTAPEISDLVIANTSSALNNIYYLDFNNRMPSFSGLATDYYRGSTKINSNGITDTFDKVSSGPKTLTLTFKKLGSDDTYTEYLTKDYSLSDIENIANDKKTSKFYITTPFPLVDGYYEVNLSLKDEAGNVYNNNVFYLSLNYQEQISTPVPLGGISNTTLKNLETEIIDQKEIPIEEEKDMSDETPYSVQVKVVDTNQKPIEGATVELHSTPRTTVTDKDGIAKFDDVEKGDHRILIAYDGQSGEQKVTLEGDETLEFQYTIQIKPTSPFKDYRVIGVIAFILIISTTIIIIQRRK